MIRDSYYKEHQNSGLTSRELKGIQKFGERAFYTSSVTKMSGNVKSFNFSFKVSLICSSLLLLLILIVAIVNTQSLLTLVGILGTIFALVTFIVCILWFALFKKGYEKKIEKYRQKIKEISEKEVKKRMALYERTKNQ